MGGRPRLSRPRRPRADDEPARLSLDVAARRRLGPTGRLRLPADDGGRQHRRPHHLRARRESLLLAHFRDHGAAGARHGTVARTRDGTATGAGNGSPIVVKTIAIYTDARGFGGAEVQLLSLAQHLDRSRFRPVVLYSDCAGLAPFAARLATLGIEAHHVPPLTDAGQLANVPRLASLLRR